MSILGLSNQQIQQIESDFKHLPVLRGKEILALINELNPEEQICLKFLYAYMPAADLVSYPFSYFLNAVQQTLNIQKKVSWKKLYEGELFFNYILPPRINNEDLTDYRMAFFEELYPRVENLSPGKAALEVNYWCYEKATYRSTDFRTLSPLGVIRNTFGRCGEESVLLVAALRSIGIPARQCYSPRWAHCDDNHAWVEVYTENKWEFLGACEPEAQLNQAWFIMPASRAMLIQARVFSKIVTDEQVVSQTPIVTLTNITHHYANTKRLTVSVRDKKQNPVVGALVRFQVLNFSQFFPIASLTTDQNGEVNFDTGYGDLFVHISKDGVVQEKHIDAQEEYAEIQLTEKSENQEREISLIMNPPTGENSPLLLQTKELTAQEENQHKERLRQGESIRRNTQLSFFQEDRAKQFASQFPEKYQADIARLIASSAGNYHEIARFLQEKKNLPLHFKVQLLQSLRPKDLSDITAQNLWNHLFYAMPYEKKYTKDIFVPYILCPRVQHEMIDDFRPYLTNFFSASQVNAFRQNPMEIYKFVEDTVTDCGNREYETLYASPKELLQYPYGSLQSRKVLFVSIARTLGIPARLNPVDNTPEYYQDNSWTRATSFSRPAQNTAKLILKKQNAKTEFIYEKNFTVSRRREDGYFFTLQLEETSFEGNEICYSVEPGFYRIVTSNRLQDGSALLHLYEVVIHGSEQKEIEISLNESQAIAEEKKEIPLLSAKTLQGKEQKIQACFAEDKTQVLAYLETGKEPTEHLLNEICENFSAFQKLAQRVVLLCADPLEAAYPLLQKVLQETGIQLLVLERDSVDFKQIRAVFGQENPELPLVLALQGKTSCVFSISGYHVGTGDLLLSHLQKNKV